MTAQEAFEITKSVVLKQHKNEEADKAVEFILGCIKEAAEIGWWKINVHDDWWKFDRYRHFPKYHLDDVKDKLILLGYKVNLEIEDKSTCCYNGEWSFKMTVSWAP